MKNIDSLSLSPTLRRIAWWTCFLLNGAMLALMLYAILTGLPPVVFGKILKMKQIKPLFTLWFLSLLGLMTLNEEGPSKGFSKWGNLIKERAGKPYFVWLLFAVASLLFTWQQITEYYAIKINFLPFSFFDYMLYYFFHQKINYTGLLHGYYHFNNILYLLAPLWKLIPSSKILILLYGPLAAASVFPLWAICKNRLKSPLLCFLTVFLYFNYRFLQNLLQMNFSIEVLYPLFIFSAVYFAIQKQWLLYYVMIFLELLVKEDSFIYAVAIGTLVLFLNRKSGSLLGFTKQAWHGPITMIASVFYFFFLTRIFDGWTGNTVIEHSSMNNYAGYIGVNTTPSQLVRYLILHPQIIFDIYLGSPDKWKTYSKLFAHLGFIPFLSPSVLLIAMPLFPLFLHATGRDTDFFQLNYHYGAAVIPFVFIAFVFGLSNLSQKIKGKTQKNLFYLLGIALILLNGGFYRTEHFTRENLKTIHLVKMIPSGANLVTHGHLLPYAGYRQFNYYFAEPFELSYHPYHTPFINADYYYFDDTVNPYPMGKAYFDQKIAALQKNPRYAVLYEDTHRLLFKRLPSTKP